MLFCKKCGKYLEMCTLADIKNQSIQGFARKTDFKPGNHNDLKS